MRTVVVTEDEIRFMRFSKVVLSLPLNDFPKSEMFPIFRDWIFSEHLPE